MTATVTRADGTTFEAPIKIVGDTWQAIIRENTPDSYAATITELQNMGLTTDTEWPTSLLYGCKIKEVPIITSPPVYGSPTTEMRDTWEWAADPDTGERLLDDNGEQYRVKTGEQIETVIAEAPLITPATVDPRKHFNVYISAAAVSRVLSLPDGHPLAALNGERSAVAWVLQYALATDMDPDDQNNHEAGKVRSGVTLIDPDSIDTPARVRA
jgi:hypothetical protein